jgi:hypothetical protein
MKYQLILKKIDLAQTPLWETDIGASPINVRFTPKSGHRNSVLECPFCAKSRLMHRSKNVAIRSAQLHE